MVSDQGLLFLEQPVGIADDVHGQRDLCSPRNNRQNKCTDKNMKLKLSNFHRVFWENRQNNIG